MKQIKVNPNNEQFYSNEFIRGFNLGAERQYKADIAYMPTWIPCNERLPEEKGEYLVTYHPCYWDIVEPEVRVGIDTFRGKTSWAKKKYQKVIAWKPLPMPWEGEKDE